MKQDNLSSANAHDEINLDNQSPKFCTPEELFDQIWNKDEFGVNQIEEEFLLFPGEILDKATRRLEGPHKPVKWRLAAR